MPPVGGDNEKGFWEDVDLNKLNIDLLNFFHQNWHDLTPPDHSELLRETLSSFKIRAIELLRDKIANSAVFAMKDPRTARVLPFWKFVFEHLGLDVGYVIVLRHPMSVARSLEKRNGFDPEKSYYLWLQHMVPSMLDTEGCRRVVVDYDRIMDEAGGQLKRIAERLGLPPPAAVGPEVWEYANAFLEKGLRHSRFRPEDLLIDRAVPREVIDAYEILRRLACDELPPDSPVAHEEFVRLSRWLGGNMPAFRYMSKLDARVDGLQRAAANRDTRLAALDQEVARSDVGGPARGD
jgi:hypothetical protein